MTKCAICGRTLKSAASIAAGVGPECSKGRRGRRHKGPGMTAAGGGHYQNGANGHGGVMVPPVTGEPLTTAEALAAIRRVAEDALV